jgi:dynein heavy chain
VAVGGTHLTKIKALYLGVEGSDQEDLVEAEVAMAMPAVVDCTEALQSVEELRKELVKLRSGEEAVRFFAKNATAMQFEYIYCNRLGTDGADVFAPCDLQIVDQWQALPEHFIISATGIVRVCPGQPSERMSLFEWMHESSMLTVLSSMTFFKQFGRRRAFAQWRSAARYEDYSRRRQRLKRGCLLARPPLVQYVVQAQSLARSAQGISSVLLVPGGKHAYPLHEFLQFQAESRQRLKEASDQGADRRDQAAKLLAEVAGRVRAAAEEDPQVLLGKLFRHGPRVHSKGMVAKKEEDKEKARLQQILDSDVARLGDCAQLAGYQQQAALVDAALSAASGTLARLEASGRMLLVRAEMDEDGSVALQPGREQFEEVVHTIRRDLLKCVDAVSALSSTLEFRQLAPHVRNQQSAAEALAACGRFDEYIGKMQDIMCSGFDAALGLATSTYGPLGRVYRFGIDFDEGEARHSSEEQAGGRISLMQEFQTDIDGLRSHYSAGLFLLDGKEIKTHLAQVPLRVLRVMSGFPEPHPQAEPTLELLKQKEEARGTMSMTVNGKLTTACNFRLERPASRAF